MEDSIRFIHIINNPSKIKPIIDDIYKEKGELGVIQFSENVSRTHNILPNLKAEIHKYCIEKNYLERELKNIEYLNKKFTWNWRFASLIISTISLVVSCISLFVSYSNLNKDKSTQITTSQKSIEIKSKPQAIKKTALFPIDSGGKIKTKE